MELAFKCLPYLSVYHTLQVSESTMPSSIKKKKREFPPSESNRKWDSRFCLFTCFFMKIKNKNKKNIEILVSEIILDKISIISGRKIK
jgi:hypothetical protein